MCDSRGNRPEADSFEKPALAPGTGRQADIEAFGLSRALGTEGPPLGRLHAASYHDPSRRRTPYSELTLSETGGTTDGDNAELLRLAPSGEEEAG
jgi:hypothetical protein